MTLCPRVLIFVQHLRGIGHLQRAAVIARALVANGLGVDLVSGGMPVAGLGLGGARLHQLAPLRSPDDTYTRLLDAAGAEAGAPLHAARIGALRGILDAVKPDAVMVEMFPFGRSQIAAEMVALIEAARAAPWRPLVLSSVRDLVAAKTSRARYREMAGQVAAWFDAVLVHGDANVIPFGESFPEAERIGRFLHYTGYVVADGLAPASPAEQGREVIVSAGGGVSGMTLMRAAISSRADRALDPTFARLPWRLITGPNLPDADAAELARRAGDGLVVERARSDFRRLLARARVSVSQCGYNTAVEVIATGIPAVMVPFGAGRQTEQHARARALARMGLAEVVPQGKLDGPSLARAIASAAAAPAGSRRAPEIDLSGAQTTARLVRRWLAARAGGKRAGAAPAAESLP